jgi:predicted metal-binding membrane protein
MVTGTRDCVALPASRALVATLLAVAAGAWLLSARLAMPEMRLGVLTGATMTPARGQMGMPGSAPMGVIVFIATWTVMMVAMMVPSFIPAARAFDTVARAAERSGGAVALFTAGYLLVWSMIGGVAYLVVRVLHTWLPAGSVTALRGGAMLLVVAGLYQLTPPKRACLRHCRSRGVVLPVGTRSQAYLGAVRAGLGQGMSCLGSSWPLMLVLLLVGMMNLVWMGVISAVIFVEKAVGWGLAAGGLILLVAPHVVPSPG